MNSIAERKEEHIVLVPLTESELRYLVGAGFGLLQYVPTESLSTYVNFSSDQIMTFSKRLREIMDREGISM
ncbi:hypothetical protein CQ054_22700 [Ochrobactrum sp. MYb29]|nr:hypothetical protein CQ054_22700 [Ochrobactrum sp. MYb29]